MNEFERALSEGYEEIDDVGDDILEWFLEAYETDTGVDEEAIREDLQHLSVEEVDEIIESLVKHVSASGTVTKKRNRAIRARRAVSTTGMSKTALKLRARKAARSKKRNPAGLKLAKRRRAKAMRRRKSMGIK